MTDETIDPLERLSQVPTINGEETLDGSVTPMNASPKQGTGLPPRIGEYHIIDHLGSGGMSNVYLANQESPRRKVAVKVVGNRMSHRVMARFQAECHVLGMLSHPNIAQIYQAGFTEDGSPYYSMEYLDGLTLMKVVPRENLDLKQRLDLFCQVCDGMAYAHKKAVLHRDLKPSNIMVTRSEDQLVAKIIDFGIARVLDEDLFTSHETRAGDLLGTPLYMSPEQLTGADSVDVRSDVYSLGVILYELLTGLHPLQQSRIRDLPIDEVLRLCREAEIPVPSKRLREHRFTPGETQQLTGPWEEQLTMPGDLDWIVMKAMEKDITRRYQSVEALENDIRNFLENRPVTAHPPTVLYKAERYFRRHKFFLGGAAIILLALTWALFAQVRSWQREKEAAEDVREAFEFIETALSSASPRELGANVTVKEMLLHAEENLDGLDETMEAFILTTLGRTWDGLGDYEKAHSELQRAYEIRSSKLGRNHEDTLHTRLALMRTLRKLRKYDEARAHAQELFEAHKRLHGNNHVKTLEVMVDLAIAEAYSGNVADSEKLLVAFLERDLPPHESMDLLRAKALATLGQNMRNVQRPEDAEPYFLQASRILEAVGTQAPETLAVLTNLANVYIDLGSYEKASSIYERALGVSKQVRGPDHPYTIGIQLNYANSELQRSRPDLALPLIEAVFDYYVRKQDEHWQLISGLIMVDCLIGVGELDGIHHLLDDLHDLLERNPIESLADLLETHECTIREESHSL